MKNGELSSDPLSYLLTSARLIAEDDEYAVIAIRVEKKWVRSNMRFLAALVERGTLVSWLRNVSVSRRRSHRDAATSRCDASCHHWKRRHG